jgi:PST family polysaccharide transporter
MDDLQRLARRAAAIIAIPSVLLLLPCVIMPAQILSSLFGKRYSGGAFVLGALAVAQLVNVLTGLCGVVLGMCSKESILLRVSVLWAVVSVIAEVIGVKVGGMNGLALASALTTSGQFITLWILTRTELGIWTHPGLSRHAAAS